MPSTARAILQYLLILSITAFLIWLSLRAFKGGDVNALDYIWATWQSARKSWLWLMAILALLSFFLRAERWRMLIYSSGNEASLGNSLLSLLVGYLINLAVPRGGEISRCYNLYKLSGTPVEISFGTVVAERAIDVLTLGILVLLAFLVETDKILVFMDHFRVGDSFRNHALFIVLVALSVVLLCTLLYIGLRRSKRIKDKLQGLWQGFKRGLLATFSVRQPIVFISYSILIWLLYFLMSYCVLQAFPETDQLGPGAVMVLFAVGSIAMALPLPGGIGSYHTLVPASLIMLYAIPSREAVAFTFVFHGWQTLIMIVGGAAALLVTTFRVQRSASKT